MASTQDPTGRRSAGASKITATCSCGKFLIGNAAKASHKRANPTHAMTPGRDPYRGAP